MTIFLSENQERIYRAWLADPVKATIAEIWTKLIQPAQAIGRNDRFFDMGGHSLLGVQALRQMEQKLGVKLAFRVLFHESLADIATRCRTERIAEGGVHVGATSPVALPAAAGGTPDSHLGCEN